jgi:PIN domain nuclease of toxin-antitoxin system
MILLDTHALLWWALDPQQLSPAAAEALSRMERSGGYASAISIWELGVKIQRGKLEIGIAIDEFARRVKKTGAIELVPADTAIWLRALGLDWEHRDPADRVIAATAMTLGVPVLTKDDAMRRFRGVPSIW